jgi:hypothetical protein
MPPDCPLTGKFVADAERGRKLWPNCEKIALQAWGITPVRAALGGDFDPPEHEQAGSELDWLSSETQKLCFDGRRTP